MVHGGREGSEGGQPVCSAGVRASKTTTNQDQLKMDRNAPRTELMYVSCHDGTSPSIPCSGATTSRVSDGSVWRPGPPKKDKRFGRSRRYSQGWLNVEGAI